MNFPALKNTRFLDALALRPIDRTPVWMMRQAGRYLPEYKATRADAGDFLALCKNTDLACEVALQPLRRFELDASILFSDILTIPDAMGLGLYFETGEGPKFTRTVRNMQQVEALESFKTTDALGYVTDAVTAIRHALGGSVPLIGFSGSPWTLATYMIEGGSSRDFRHAKTMMYQQPEVLNALLDRLSDQVAEYLIAQVDAGAQALQIFDSWGGALSHADYVTFSLNPMRKILDKLRASCPGTPVIMFTKGGGLWLEEQLSAQPDALGIDWTVKLGQAKQLVGSRCALQGNLDPMILLGDRDNIKLATTRMLDDYYQGCSEQGLSKTGLIANLGHGITQWTNPDNAKVFIETVNQYAI